MAKFPTIEEFAKSVADKVLDDYEYEGKTIREWVELILKDELTKVVRCKECKNYGDEYFCPLRSLADYTDPNDYCSMGERQEDDG